MNVPVLATPLLFMRNSRTCYTRTTNALLLQQQIGKNNDFRRTSFPESRSSSSSSSSTKKGSNKTLRLHNANPERIRGIQVNPESMGYEILPGNLIYKKIGGTTGETKKIPLELVHGYFWMVSDLKKTDQKPTLSNDRLIPQREAQFFPALDNLYSLTDNENPLNIPMVFTENAAVGEKITLLSITFRDNGFKLNPSWFVPFEDACEKHAFLSNRVQTFHVNISERIVLYPLQNILRRVMTNNTPINERSKTLTYFGIAELSEFRDVLRMHNIMTNYIFLLDDLGRVRWCGSGAGSEKEVARLISCSKALLRECDRNSTKNYGNSTTRKQG